MVSNKVFPHALLSFLSRDVLKDPSPSPPLKFQAPPKKIFTFPLNVGTNYF